MRKTGSSGRVRWARIGIGIFLALQSTGALAAEESMGYSVLKFGGGIVSAFLIHEAAHEGVALATGTTITWSAGDVNQPLTFKEACTSREKGLALNSTGLIAQAAAAEVILQSDKIDKNDSFIRGMMLWNLLNPITYAIDYWFLQRTNSTRNNGLGYQGDLQGVERYSSGTSANVFSATLVAMATFQGYRYAKTQTWAPEWLKGKELDNVGLAPLPSGGALLSYSFEF